MSSCKRNRTLQVGLSVVGLSGHNFVEFRGSLMKLSVIKAPMNTYKQGQVEVKVTYECQLTGSRWCRSLGEGGNHGTLY